MSTKSIGTYCRGFECPSRNTCLRYTKRGTATSCMGGYNVINKCTNGKRYLQDTDKVNPSCRSAMGL